MFVPCASTGTTLVVAADHPVWATRARVESGRILAQVQALGGGPVEHLDVVVERP